MKVAVLAVVERSMTYDAASIRYEVPRSTLQDRVKKVKEGKLNVQRCGLKGLGHYQKVFSIEQENVLAPRVVSTDPRTNFGRESYGLQLTGEQIFNVDECGLSNVAKSRAKIISQKGRRQVGKLSSAERGQNVKIVVCHTKKTQRERNGTSESYKAITVEKSMSTVCKVSLFTRVVTCHYRHEPDTGQHSRCSVHINSVVFPRREDSQRFPDEFIGTTFLSSIKYTRLNWEN
ncbi:hypothetical protein QTP88_011638 [Uroleucon formosanum]